MKRIILVVFLCSLASCGWGQELLSGEGKDYQLMNHVVCFTPGGNVMFNGTAQEVRPPNVGREMAWQVLINNTWLTTNGVCLWQMNKVAIEPKEKPKGTEKSSYSPSPSREETLF